MNANALKQMITQQSFEPFELILSSGDRYPVRHPENCVPMKDRVFIAYSSSRKTRFPDDFAFLSYLHIAAAEPLNKRSA